MRLIKGSAVAAVRDRLNRVAKEFRGGARSADPDAVHHLRVAIRRLTEAIRTFPEVCGAARSKKYRRQLKPVLHALGDVRNLDVTNSVLEAARAKPASEIATQMRSQKTGAHKVLDKTLRTWRKQRTV